MGEFERDRVTDIFYFSSVGNHSLVERVLMRLFFGMVKNYFNEHFYMPQFEEYKWISYDIDIADRVMKVSQMYISWYGHMIYSASWKCAHRVLIRSETRCFSSNGRPC